MTAAPIRLLLLEDNAGDARLVQAALADNAPGEFAITTVERLADALARIGAEPFDAMLCDLGLPDSTGLATAQAIADRAPALPLVVLTGSHDEDLGREAIQHGAQDYLAKDEANGSLIARTLRYAIERKRLEIGLRTANEVLEHRVAERTAELESVNNTLRESEQKYRGIYENLQDVYIEADLDQTILEISPQIEVLSRGQYTRDDVLGKSTDMFHAEPARRDAFFLALGEHGAVKDFEATFTNRDGAPVVCSISAKIQLGTDGTTRRVCATVRDITERKKAEEQLRAAEEQFRGLVEQSIAGIYIIQDGTLAYVNPRFAEIFGYDSPNEMIGLSQLSLTAEKDRATMLENVRRRIEGETRTVTYNFSGLRRDGSTVELGTHGAAATYLGRPAIIGMMQNISEKKRADEQIQHYVAQIENAFMSTVQVVTTLGEMRDAYTAGHQRRVAEVSVAIGAELGFDARRQEGLRVAGYLHDIGKIRIPSEILSKPKKLTLVEFQLVQGHAQASYDVLKDVAFPWPVAEVALQHHERMDGSGYPQGLKGEAILLEARILAVADVVEAMSSHRPYRAGLGLEAALAEIERGRGSAYDTAVADACLKLFREKGYAIPA